MTRARDLGIPFDGLTGPWNAITDVPGVEVGYATIITGEGALQVGVGPVRTGVTAILPRGRASHDPIFAGGFPSITSARNWRRRFSRCCGNDGLPFLNR